MTHLTRNLGRLGASVWLGLACACAPSREATTQLFVKIDGDVLVSDALQQLTVSIYDPDATDEDKPAQQQVFMLTHGEPSGTLQRMPFSFGISKGRSERIKIVVKGYKSSATDAPAVVEQKTVVNFRNGQGRWVSLYLSRGCYSLPVPCVGLDRTCVAPADPDAYGECGVIDELDTLTSEPQSAAPSSAASEDSGGCSTARLCTLPDYPCVESQVSGYECLGQFADWPVPSSLGDAAHVPNYTSDDETKTVVDEVTGLIWQRDLPMSYNGCASGSRCTWAEAKRYCGQLTLDAKTWRLPTKIELESIVSETHSAPALEPEFPLAQDFQVDAFRFWSASPVIDHSLSNESWFVDFGYGTSDYIDGQKSFHVRCVRSVITTKGTPAERYELDATANTVADTRTGLVWQRDISMPFEKQADAQGYCDTKDGNWRLPSFKELLTLVDPSRPSPTLDPVFSTIPAGGFFWSSTPIGLLEGRWYVVCSYIGFTIDDVDAVSHFMQIAPDKPELQQIYARCVHNR